MKKDLENLAKEMQKLEHEDRLYWLRSMGHCREIAHPSTYPTYKTLNQIFGGFELLRNSIRACGFLQIQMNYKKFLWQPYNEFPSELPYKILLFLL